MKYIAPIRFQRTKGVFTVLLMVALVSGCETTLKQRITSEPQGATIYAGKSKSSLALLGYTPFEESYTVLEPAQFDPWCYQAKLAGYVDSPVLCKPATSGDRIVHFVLQPKQASTEVEKAKTNRRLRREILNGISEDEMIVFGPENAKHTITVFTDIDCPHCRTMHAETGEYIERGIRIRYLAFPRFGPGTASFKKAVSVWCAPDRRQALSLAMNGYELDPSGCRNPVLRQYALGRQLGIKGVPAMLLENGELINGYVPARPLLRHLDSLSEERVTAPLVRQEAVKDKTTEPVRMPTAPTVSPKVELDDVFLARKNKPQVPVRILRPGEVVQLMLHLSVASTPPNKLIDLSVRLSMSSAGEMLDETEGMYRRGSGRHVIQVPFPLPSQASRGEYVIEASLATERGEVARKNFVFRVE